MYVIHKFDNEKSGQTQTLHTGCSKVEPKIFALLQIPSRGTGWPKFDELGRDGQNLHLQTEFGEIRCTQF